MKVCPDLLANGYELWGFVEAGVIKTDSALRI
jgi:hypothetical protein